MTAAATKIERSGPAIHAALAESAPDQRAWTRAESPPRGRIAM